MHFTKSIFLNGDVCYTINKCCKIAGYAYRLGYVNPDSKEIQTIYNKKITFNKDFYGEVNVKFQLKNNAADETCWSDLTLFSRDDKKLTVSEPKFEFTGAYHLQFEENIFEIFLKEEVDSAEPVA